MPSVDVLLLLFLPTAPTAREVILPLYLSVVKKLLPIIIISLSTTATAEHTSPHRTAASCDCPFTRSHQPKLFPAINTRATRRSRPPGIPWEPLHTRRPFPPRRPWRPCAPLRPVVALSAHVPPRAARPSGPCSAHGASRPLRPRCPWLPCRALGARWPALAARAGHVRDAVCARQPRHAGGTWRPPHARYFGESVLNVLALLEEELDLALLANMRITRVVAPPVHTHGCREVAGKAAAPSLLPAPPPPAHARAGGVSCACGLHSEEEPLTLMRTRTHSLSHTSRLPIRRFDCLRIDTS